MTEGLRNHGSNVIGSFGRESQETCGLSHLCEIWVEQVCSKIEDAGSLHFQFDKGKRVVF